VHGSFDIGNGKHSQMVSLGSFTCKKIQWIENTHTIYVVDSEGLINHMMLNINLCFPCKVYNLGFPIVGEFHFLNVKGETIKITH